MQLGARHDRACASPPCSPHNAECQYFAGVATHALGHVDDALVRYRKADGSAHEATGDKAQSVNSLENADAIAGETHPEIAYELGRAYADASPPRQDRAQRLFESFIKRRCLGSKRHTLEQQCQEAERWLSSTTP